MRLSHPIDCYARLREEKQGSTPAEAAACSSVSHPWRSSYLRNGLSKATARHEKSVSSFRLTQNCYENKVLLVITRDNSTVNSFQSTTVDKRKASNAANVTRRWFFRLQNYDAKNELFGGLANKNKLRRDKSLLFLFEKSEKSRIAQKRTKHVDVRSINRKVSWSSNSVCKMATQLLEMVEGFREFHSITSKILFLLRSNKYKNHLLINQCIWPESHSIFPFFFIIIK